MFKKHFYDEKIKNAFMPFFERKRNTSNIIYHSNHSMRRPLASPERAIGPYDIQFYAHN